ncbi:MAG TPA: hypothetical protein VG963_00425, partial [Polyangiaceae bacterium]|nr:hypothetical protein [Polyangiaceae bacterium]
MPYGVGLAGKAERLGAALRRYPDLPSVSPEAPCGAERATAYRIRAKLVTDGKNLGLFAAGSHDVVDLPGCLVLDPRLAE